MPQNWNLTPTIYPLNKLWGRFFKVLFVKLQKYRNLLNRLNNWELLATTSNVLIIRGTPCSIHSKRKKYLKNLKIQQSKNAKRLKIPNYGSGCGSVGRVVASDIRGPRLNPVIGKKLYWTLSTVLKRRKKWVWPILKNTQWYLAVNKLVITVVALRKKTSSKVDPQRETVH